MATYKEAGVDIDLGDKCSALAYQAAKNTFAGRQGMIGQPVLDEGGFAGALDMGDFYLIQNDDGVGTKMAIAEMIGKYDTLGYDLVAMVADDAACVGAETVSVSNTLDVDKLDEKKVAGLMTGLEAAALQHKIVIPGGEIAEVGDAVTSYVWNATAVGILEKNKAINGEKIVAGDKIIGLKSAGFRSNGFSLVRYILKEKFGETWADKKFDTEKTWGEVTLTPSKIYCSAIMELHGRYKQQPKVDLKGVAHVTGGGIVGNLKRVLKKTGLGAQINNLPTPHESMLKLMEFGNVAPEEAYKTWNMGVGMLLVASESEVEKIQEICQKMNVDSQVIGEVKEGEIEMDFPDSTKF